MKETKVYVNNLNVDKITVVDYNGEAQDYSINDTVYVDDTNYQQEFIKQPAKYAYWSSILQGVKRVEADQENQLDQLHAKLYNEAFTSLNQRGIKPTKDLIESQIEQSDEYFQAKQRVSEAQYSVGQVNTIVKALEQRAQMLISYGADQRKDKTYGN